MTDPYADIAEPISSYDAISTPVAKRQKAAAQKRGEARVSARSKDKGILRKIDAGVRGAADFLTLGFADEAAAGVEALPGLVRGGLPALKADYEANLLAEQATDELDRKQAPVSRAVGQVGGLVGTLGTGALANAGVRGAMAGQPIAQGLLRGGGMAGGIVRGALGGATAGAVQGAGSSAPGVESRVGGAQQGALLGGLLGGAAQPVAGLLGAGVRGVANRARGGPLRVLAGRAPNAAAEVARLRSMGIEPTITDVVDEGGRGMIRAAASRNTPGREVAQRFADSRALNLPGRISAQTRRTVSADPRSPMQIAEELAAGRRAQANSQFGAVRGEAVTPTPEMVDALRTDHARSAIGEAVRRERDPEVRAALNRLQGSAFDNPSDLGLTVGMTDRVSRVLAGQAQAAARAGDNDLATTLGDLSRDLRVPARNQVPGYADALEGFAQESRAIEAAGRGEDFLSRNTDEFVADVGAMDPRGVELARATARRAVERAAGENVAQAPALARRLANAPEQQARNAALLGENAVPFQDAMRAEEMLVRNASDIAPRSGSRTGVNLGDAEAFGQAAGTVGRAVRGDWIGVGMDFVKSRLNGLTDDMAEQLVIAATDPGQTDRVLETLSRHVPRQEAIGIVNQLQQLSTRNLSENAASAQPRVVRRWVNAEGTPYVELEFPDSRGMASIEVPDVEAIKAQRGSSQ